MSHLLENASDMFYAGNEVPWHGLGVSIPDATTEDIRALECLRFEVACKPIFDENGNDCSKLGKFCYRTDNNRVFGIVGPRYTPYQCSDMLDWCAPFVESGLAKWETAGVLQGGAKTWTLLSIVHQAVADIVANDTVKNYVLVSNSNDGTLAIRCGFTPVRVVCWNTMSAAIFDKANSKLIRVRHNKNVVETMNSLRETFDLAAEGFKATCEKFQHLASKGCNLADLRKYVKILCDVPTEKDENDVHGKSLNKVNDIVNLCLTGKGNDLPGVAGTWWSAYNGVTEHLTWKAGRNNDNRLNSLWFGQGAAFNTRALDLALALAG